MKEAERVRKTAENSVGSAWREQEKWATSLQGHLGSLNASFEKFASISLNNEWIKFFIDLVKGVLDLGSALGGIVPILFIVSTAFLTIKNEMIQSFVIKNIVDKVFLLREAFMGTAMATSTFAGIITGGLSLAIVGVIALIKHFHQSSAELQQQLGKTADEYKQHTENINNYTSKLETAKKCLDELNKLKEQGNITAKQAEELNLLKRQNDELERKLNAEKTLAEIKQRQQNSEAIQAIESKSEKIQVLHGELGTSYRYTDISTNKQDAIVKLFQNYEKEQKYIVQLEQEIISGTFDDDIIEEKKEELNNIKENLSKTKDNIAIINSSLLDNVDKLSKGQYKSSLLDFVSDVEQRLKSISDTAKDATENIVNLGNISSKYKDSDSLKNEQEDLQKYYDEYDKNGILSVQTVNDMLAKYPQYLDFLIKTADGYKLNTDALERLNSIKQTQKDITDKYIDSLNKEKDAVSSRDFVENFYNGLTYLKQDFENEYEIPPEILKDFGSLIDKINNVNKSFIDGKTDIVQYFTQIQDSIDSINLHRLKDNIFGKALIDGLIENVSNGIKFANDALSAGKISALEYVSAVDKANKSLISMYAAENDLSYIDGKWKNRQGQVDEYAQSLQNASNEIKLFGSYLTTLDKNSKYISENINAIGEAFFTSTDVGTAAFANLTNSLKEDLYNIRDTSVNVFNEIVDAMAKAGNMTREEMLDENNNFKDGVLDNASVVNTALNTMASKLSTSISKTISAIGNMISDFKMSLKFSVPEYTKISILGKKFEIPTGIDIQAQGGYSYSEVGFDGKSFNQGETHINDIINPKHKKELENATEELIGNTKLTVGDLLGISNKGNSTPANRNSSSSSKGGGSKGGSNRTDTPVELKEIEKVDEYTKAIDKLNFKLEILGNDREFLVDTSDEYVKSLNTEISLIREKSSLTDKEIEKVEKELKTYSDLDKQKIKVEQLRKNAKTNDDKKQVNNEIEKYNKRLSTRESLEKKLQSLNKTNIDLEKQEIQIRQKKYDLVLKSTNDEISNNEKQISLLQSKQKFFAEGSVEYSSLTDCYATIDL
ncbi:MAG: hypothetical protein ACTTKD_07335 [Peptoanaerobacter stomatis]|uniref:hypothetical protein n=1 Tax=Peptoanaerobacter stomatis TaxID=796937 RepID=UPI003F9FE560